MTKIQDYLFKVLNLSSSIRSHYGDNLGWFFDDYNNPLSFPNGIASIWPDDAADELKVTFVPDKISLDQIKAYLLEIGIESIPLGEYKDN